MKIRGREFSTNDIKIIKEISSNHPQLSRRQLSLLISEALNWRQPNGNLKDRACRDVLLRLSKHGIIQLPEGQSDFSRQSIQIKSIDFLRPASDLVGTVNDFNNPSLKVVQRINERQLWNYLIDNYHYKGCRITVGRHLKYFIYLENQIIGCIAFADSVLKLTARDQWVGWTLQQREANLHLIINNVRFLILPWVKVRNLASKLLSLSARIIPSDWQGYYHFRPVLLETFVDQQRFSGASYKAANWLYLGQTQGKGRSGMNYYYHGIIKDIYIYPLLKPEVIRHTLTRIIP
ncbi:MAG: DUF4338 domain-containing protein [bacterium]|nr:MAG: DUF4338 domain-containing protein [bacterium]